MSTSVSEQANSKNELRRMRRVKRGGGGGKQAEPKANQAEPQAEIGASKVDVSTTLGAFVRRLIRMGGEGKSERARGKEGGVRSKGNTEISEVKSKSISRQANSKNGQCLRDLDGSRPRQAEPQEELGASDIEEPTKL